MTTEPDTRNALIRRLIPLLALLALLAGGLGWQLWSCPVGPLGPGRAGGAGAKVAKPEAEAPPPGGYRAADPVDLPATGLGSPKVTAARLRVTCIHDATPVPQVPVDIKVVTRVGAEPRSSLQTIQTGAAGDARFTVDGVITSLLAQVATPRWRSPVALTAKDFAVNSDTGEYEATLKLVPLARLYIDVRYDDETPYDGAIELSSAGWRQSPTIMQGRGEVPDVPRADLICCAPTRRTGFATLFETVPASQIVADGRIALVLVKSPWPRSGLIVRVPQVVERYGNGVAMDLNLRVIFADLGHAIREGRMTINKEGAAVFTDLQLRPGTYRVSVQSGRWVAQATVLLGVNETQELELTLETGATVRARIQDPDGKPLKRAVLRYPEGNYTTFPARAVGGGRQALSNIEGVAELEGVSPVAQTLLVEAEGYEVFPIDVAPIAGALTEVTCRLSPATGRLVITLAKGVEGGLYVVSWMHPTVGGAEYQRRPLKHGEQLVIERLPRRPYNIVVQGGANGPLAQADIDLARPECDGRVEVDVSNLVPVPQ